MAQIFLGLRVQLVAARHARSEAIKVNLGWVVLLLGKVGRQSFDDAGVRHTGAILVGPTLQNKVVLLRRVIKDELQDLEVALDINLSQKLDLVILRYEVNHIVAKYVPVLGREKTSWENLTHQKNASGPEELEAHVA